MFKNIGVCNICGREKQLNGLLECRSCAETRTKGINPFFKRLQDRNFIRDGIGIVSDCRGLEWELTLDEFEKAKDILWHNDLKGNAVNGDPNNRFTLTNFLGRDRYAKRRGKLVVNKVTNVNPYKEGMIIYKATSPSGKIYIGKTTTTLNERRRRHENSIRSKKKTYFIKALIKYGIENIQWEVIDTTNNFHELNRLEEYWIKYYDSINSGYNIQIGGVCGNFGISPSQEVRDKISKTLTGRPTGRKGCKMPEGTVLKVLDSRKIGWLVLYDLEGVYTAKFRKTQDAADFIGCTVSGIEYVLSGGVKQCRGYICKRFQPDDIPQTIEISRDYFMRDSQYYFEVHKDGSCIGKWNNQRKCALDLNVYYKNINACLMGKQRTARGYIFTKVNN